MILAAIHAMDAMDRPIENANHAAITQVATIMVHVFVNQGGAEMIVISDMGCIQLALVTHIRTQTCMVPVSATLTGVDITVLYTLDIVIQFVMDVMDQAQPNAKPASTTHM